jgi:hypothetical protein
VAIAYERFSDTFFLATAGIGFSSREEKFCCCCCCLMASSSPPSASLSLSLHRHEPIAAAGVGGQVMHTDFANWRGEFRVPLS